MGYSGAMKVMNIEMGQSCSRRILESICKNAGLKLDTKYDSKKGIDLYSVEGSEFVSVKDATRKAIFECEMNGQWIESFGIKDRVGYPIFKRVG